MGGEPPHGFGGLFMAQISPAGPAQDLTHTDITKPFQPLGDMFRITGQHASFQDLLHLVGIYGRKLQAIKVCVCQGHRAHTRQGLGNP